MMNAADGKIISTLPLAGGSDGAVFNPATKEVFSSAGNGTLTVIKEDSPTAFSVEQIVQTMPSAKTARRPPGFHAGRVPLRQDARLDFSSPARLAGRFCCFPMVHRLRISILPSSPARCSTAVARTRPIARPPFH